jgi:hypothetical protein
MQVSVENTPFVEGLERIAERAPGHEHVFLFAGHTLV